MQLSSSFCLISSGSAENPVCVISEGSAIFYSSGLYNARIFLPGEVKKYNIAISVFFGNLKLKNCVLLISLTITLLYLLSVAKNLPVISNCCCLSNILLFWNFTDHKIDPNNRFFQKLFRSSRNCSVFCKCLRCDDFLTTSDFKIKHDFLKHFDEGYNDLFEDKPVDTEKRLR